MPSGRAPMRRSDPNANARKPFKSSAAVKCVNCDGAPSNEPGGACCRPDAPSAAVTNEMRIMMQTASQYFIVQSGFPPLAHQTFLRHRGDQHPITGEYKSARIAARAMQVGRILCVKQPIVGAKRAVKPERVIEARGHK